MEMNSKLDTCTAPFSAQSTSQMSIKAATNLNKFTSVVTNQRFLRNNEDCPVRWDKTKQPIEIIRRNKEEQSIKESFKEMSIEEEKDHKLTSLKPKKSKIRSMYKHQYVDEQGGVIILRAASVSLHIPAGSLSERTLISIEVKSAANRTMSDLDQSSSLTPIVSCQPDGQKFKKPVELIVPHCAEFDDISLHKATVQIHEGNISVAKETNSPYDNVRCVLKERYCHIYTTHFSNVEVGIINCLKKRMLVVPFSGGNNKLHVNVWIINDLPSEYSILLQEQENLKFAPFNHTGKFIFENHGQCSLKVQSSINGVNLTENVKELDIQQLVTNIRNLYDFEIEKQVTETSPNAVTVSLLKEPVLYLQKEIRGGDRVESLEDETCTSDENETLFDERLHIESESPSFDIPQKIGTFQTDIFHTIKTMITDIFLSITELTKEYHPQKKGNLLADFLTKVTALHPALFKIISSFSGDIFWELSPDERELIKGISSFNEDLFHTVSTLEIDIFKKSIVLQKDFSNKTESLVEEISKFCDFSFEFFDFLLHMAFAIDESSAGKLCNFFNLEQEVTEAIMANVNEGYEFVKFLCTSDILMPAGILKLEMASRELELTGLLKVIEHYDRLSNLKEFKVGEEEGESDVSILRTQSKRFHTDTNYFRYIGKELNNIFRREYSGTTFVKFDHSTNDMMLRVSSCQALHQLCVDITSGKLAEILVHAFGDEEESKLCRMRLTYDQVRREQVQEQFEIDNENRLLCLSMQQIYILIEEKFQLLIRKEIESGCLYFSQDEVKELQQAARDVESIQSKTNYSLAGGSVMGIAGGAAIIVGMLTPISPLVVTAGAIASAVGGIASLSSSVSQSVNKTKATGEKKPLLEKIRDLVHVAEIVLKAYAIFFSNTGISKKIAQRYRSVCYGYTLSVHCTIDDTTKHILKIIESGDKSGIEIFQSLDHSINILFKSMQDIGITQDDLIFAKDNLFLSRDASIQYIRAVHGHLTDTGLVALKSDNRPEENSKAEKIAIGKLGTKQAGLMGVKASKKVAGITAKSGAAGKLTSEITESAAKTAASASAKVFKVLGLSLTVAGIAFDSYALVQTVKNLCEGSKTDVSDGFRELGKLVTKLVESRKIYLSETKK